MVKESINFERKNSQTSFHSKASNSISNSSNSNLMLIDSQTKLESQRPEPILQKAENEISSQESSLLKIYSVCASDTHLQRPLDQSLLHDCIKAEVSCKRVSSDDNLFKGKASYTLSSSLINIEENRTSTCEEFDQTSEQ